MLKFVRGTTIIETLLGLSLGAFIVGGGVAMLYGVLRANTQTQRVTQLDHELRTSMSLISSELRRAGYWGNNIDDVETDQNNNPFMTANTAVQFSGSNCVLFSYDANNDGSIPALNAGTSDERFGFRLVNNTLQSRPSTHNTFSCDDDADQWDDLTNSNRIQITNFSVTEGDQTVSTGGATGTVTVKQIDISITGTLAADNSIIRTYTESVRIRNDVFDPNGVVP